MTVTPSAVIFAAHGLDAPTAPEERPTRGEITAWSSKSRTRMVKTLAMLDYAPLFAGRRTPGMLTMTMPGDWLTVAPTGPAFKRLFVNWLKRYEKAWGSPLVHVWKLEFQDRGAPHLHLFAAPPHGTAVCRCRLCGRREGRSLAFREWFSHSWAATVNHPDPEEYRKHVAAGTGIDYREGLRATDPKRLAIYFGKHGGAAGGKEYQHRVPDEWTGEGNGPGHFWGFRGLEKVTASVDVAVEDWDAMKRAARKWSARQAFFPPASVSRFPTDVRPRVRRVRVQRGHRLDRETGELVPRYRWVTRRSRYLAGSAGGFVLPNDGPAFVSALARYQEIRTCPERPAASQRVLDPPRSPSSRGSLAARTASPPCAATPAPGR